MGMILFKRALRDLKAGWARYLALSVLIIFSLFIVISLMGASVTVIDGTEKSNAELCREDGEFSVFVPLRDDEVKKLTDKGIRLEKICFYNQHMPIRCLVKLTQIIAIFFIIHIATPFRYDNYTIYDYSAAEF